MRSTERACHLVFLLFYLRSALCFAASLIFFMQAGFAMLEAGIVHPKNVTNILFKNMIDASLAALIF